MVLENFKETIDRAGKITPEQILNESQTMAAESWDSTLGALKVLPRALKNINWLELILAFRQYSLFMGLNESLRKYPAH